MSSQLDIWVVGITLCFLHHFGEPSALLFISLYLTPLFPFYLLTYPHLPYSHSYLFFFSHPILFIKTFYHTFRNNFLFLKIKDKAIFEKCFLKIVFKKHYNTKVYFKILSLFFIFLKINLTFSILFLIITHIFIIIL